MVSEKEIMDILDGFIQHYSELDEKNHKKGNDRYSDYACAMEYACRKLKRRLKTVFQNKTKKEA